MQADDPLKLLIVEQSHDEANRIISILRSADYRMEPQLACDEAQLQQYLGKRNWDLLIAPMGSKPMAVQLIFQCLRRTERDIPVILINYDYDPGKLIEGLRLGAQDVVVQDQDQHLLKVVARSLASAACVRSGSANWPWQKSAANI
jgi:PleD family two-component response regulator